MRITMAVPPRLAQGTKVGRRYIYIRTEQIPPTPHSQTPPRMLRKRMQHMIQEPNARTNSNLLRGRELRRVRRAREGRYLDELRVFLFRSGSSTRGFIAEVREVFPGW